MTSAVLPLSTPPATAPDPDPKDRSFPRTHAHTVASLLALAVGCTVLSLPIVAGTFAAFNAYNSTRALSDVRAGPAPLEDTDWSLLGPIRFAQLLIIYGILPTGVGVVYRAVEPSRGPPPPVRLAEAAVALVPPTAAMLDTSDSRLPYIGATMGALAILGLTLRAARPPSAVKVMYRVTVGTYLFLMLGWGIVLVPVAAEAARTDGELLLLRLLVLPLMTETIGFAARLGVLAVPPGSRTFMPYVWELLLRAAGALLGRMVLSFIQDARLQTLCVLLLAGEELLLRLTLDRRTRLFARLSGATAMLADAPAAAQPITAHILLFDDVAELFALLVNGAVLVFARASLTRAAPDPWATAGAVGVQLAAEVASEAALPLLAVAGFQPAQRSVRSRAAALASWSRRDVLLVSAALVIFVPQCLLGTVYMPWWPVMCGWSSHGGWYHYVPCSKASVWVG